MESLIILDRDGVINEDSKDYIKSVDEWIPIPGSLEAIARLCHRGYRVAVATNQSGIGRGLFTLRELNAMHQGLRERLATLGGRVEMIAWCPHRPEDNCACRKPRPGLLQAIGERFGRDLRGVPVVGDSLRDIEAAVAVGAEPVLVRTGKGTRSLEALAATGLGLAHGVRVFPDLASVVDSLLAGEEPA